MKENSIVGQYNENIFKFIKPNDNDMLSKMKSSDILELIILLEEYYIQLRKCIGINNDITFGLELEMEDIESSKRQHLLDNGIPVDGWGVKTDLSLNSGIEIVSPILKDTVGAWKDLNKVCDISSNYAKIGKKAGGHVHIGTHALGYKKESWVNFLKLWSVYENVIYRFVYGEFLNARPSILKYAPPISEKLIKNYFLLKNTKDICVEDVIHLLKADRKQAVNFNNVNHPASFMKNTIEFRCPNGSLNPIIWQNNVNLFANLLLYSKKISFDNDLIDNRYKINSNNNYFDFKFYDEIFLQASLELADLLFDKNIDKINFLKQYLKTYKTSKQEQEYPKSLVLTK